MLFCANPNNCGKPPGRGGVKVAIAGEVAPIPARRDAAKVAAFNVFVFMIIFSSR
jgi:hypothetical protein